MRTIFLFALLWQATFTSSQNYLDTATYAFPIGSKFILDLVPVDSINFKYHVLDIQYIDFAIDYAETDSLFSKAPIPGTIECFFAKGADQNGPFKAVLILKNNSDIILDYKALIAYDGYEGFYQTSVHSLYPNAKSSELWNDHLTAVLLHKIQKSGFN